MVIIYETQFGANTEQKYIHLDSGRTSAKLKTSKLAYMVLVNNKIIHDQGWLFMANTGAAETAREIICEIQRRYDYLTKIIHDFHTWNDRADFGS